MGSRDVFGSGRKINSVDIKIPLVCSGMKDVLVTLTCYTWDASAKEEASHGH